jgi:hypothetical protein
MVCLMKPFNFRSLSAGIGLALTACLLAGCGGGGNSPVSGTVTLDGQPLSGAAVIFEPNDEQLGRAPMGRTDDSGRYELRLSLDQRGAPPGHYIVRISTGDETGAEPIPERLPARYVYQSELTAEVRSGRNTINFELTSEGEVIQPHEAYKLTQMQN